MAERPPRRNPRLRLACGRCQRRKIRCDAQFPSCSNCKKAGAICTDGESLRLGELPRNRTLSRLRNRVAWLESIIRERLPDVDLSAGPHLDTAENNDDEENTSPLQDVQPDELSMDQGTSEQRDVAALPARPPDQRDHEIGMVSVGFNADQRYIGPSSGYFLARILLSCSPKTNESQERHVGGSRTIAQSAINELVQAAHGPLPLPAKSHATQLCEVYFDIVHPQYPILFKPLFVQSLEQLYESNDATHNNDPYSCFQVHMVLAISSTILSHRTKCHIPGESYCLSALQHLDRLNLENSFKGLQCLLLLLIFSLHSPHIRLNVWYLNYQCIAALLDLGLQRDITTASGISLLDQEMRTRVFWAVFSLDRTIATMMGRPIGLRDEACELRFPQGLGDGDLMGTLDPLNTTTSSIAFSIHLSRLARFNSEIKYVANSIVRNAPSYAYPHTTDIKAWHRDMLEQLDRWMVSMPQFGNYNRYISIICELRYHSLRMLLLRPSPAIPNPSTESLITCHEAACRSIRLFNQLYRENLLVHDWITLHGIILSTITTLYCIRAVPDIARKTELDILMNDVSISLNIISAAGEHWSGAKRSRDILDDLRRSTTRWVKSFTMSEAHMNGHLEERSPNEVQEPNTAFTASMPYPSTLLSGPTVDFASDLPPLISTSTNFPPGTAHDEAFWLGQSNQYGFSGTDNMEKIMQSLFESFIPQTDSFIIAPELYTA
ncbi:fungal-specific transcription factor domain-containing protein [Pyrenochaeta sp. MPI-SDFR-AT-0127]|nr:fungal-specific transcription factor domain-containing protein [Pyrenochaeta sp. MPI-SDFR-AT-0127]